MGVVEDEDKPAHVLRVQTGKGLVMLTSLAMVIRITTRCLYIDVGDLGYTLPRWPS